MYLQLKRHSIIKRFTKLDILGLTEGRKCECPWGRK